MKNKKIFFLNFLIIIFYFLTFTGSLLSNDEDLFSVKVKPNILFILDNSGSMSSGDVIVNDYQNFHTYTTSTGKTYTYPRYSCLDWSGGVCIRARVRRYIAMRRITTELLDNFRDDAYMGVETFFYISGGNHGSLGGQIRLSIKDLSTPDKCEDQSNPSSCTTNLNMMFDMVNGITADEYTPLAESLDTAYGYFKGAIHSGDGNTFYDYNNRPRVCSTVNSYLNCTNPTASSPLKWWCQKNFIILLTDGAPTSDEFDNRSTSTYRYYPYISAINSYRWDYDEDNDGADTKSTNGHLLDDVAKYIYDHDLISNDKTFFNLGSNYPSDFNEKQNIITYTVGLRIDIDLLDHTAHNGHGKYFTVNDYTHLRHDLMEAIYEILERTYSFTSFTAPKKIATASGDIDISFVGSFIPKQDSIWEGHLKAYNLNSDGSLGTERWDAADKIPDPDSRRLYTLDSSLSVIEFKDTNASSLRSLFGVSTDNEAEQIINFIRGVRGQTDPPYKFGDIFHSDVQFVGAPPAWKKAVEMDYDTYYNNYKDRPNVVYVGTNDGIIHVIGADPNRAPSDEGKELFGFIPDEVLPKLTDIALNNKHQETTDGKITVGDVFHYTSSTHKEWRTLLVASLRSGGNAYYGFNISDPNNISFLWKIGKVYSGTQPSYVQYLGETWAKPILGKIKYSENGTVIDKSVLIVTGGYADNAENSSDVKGKAILFFDAWDGQLLWYLAYSPTTDEQTSDHILTNSSEMNYSIPSAITAIDKNNDRYIDTIYFGNTGGNLFKLDISNPDTSLWNLTTLFKQNNKDQPIFLSPAITYDNCFNLWVTFGAGERINPKTTSQGYYFMIKDDGSSDITISDLQNLSWSGDTLAETTIDTSKKGLYFQFQGTGEKIFDPDPIILPDDNSIPHIYFNTYQPPQGISSDPCASGGEMTFYDITLSACPAGKVSGIKEEGRQAGGGFYEGNKYLMYEGKPELGSTEVKKIRNFKLPYAGGLVFWRGRRR